LMLDIYFDEGDDVPCLTNVCVIGQEGESTAEFNPNGSSDPAVEKQAAPTLTASAASATVVSASAGIAADATVNALNLATDLIQTDSIPSAISPRARALAERSGADLRFAQGSGPNGRVIERDIRQLIEAGRLATNAAAGTNYPSGLKGTGLGGRVSVDDINAAAAFESTQKAILEAAPATAESTATVSTPVLATVASESAFTTVKHTNIRKLIARSMQASLAQMAQLTLNSSFDASDIIALRTKLKKAGEQGLTAEMGFALAEKVPTLNDIILYAVSRVLKRHPTCNAHYDDDKMTFFNQVNLGVAVDTPRGLMVPTIFVADCKSLVDLSVAVKDAVAACQKGTVSPDVLKGGTFTVTNLGTLDIESFTPIINPPQTCILGVNTIITRVREVNGELKSYPAMGLSLTFDHRAIDGAPAGRFLKDLKQTLENFSLLLMH
jgi:pyruvate dehydrogenase E2 component (dihydrolipoamide acetyltransferase)